MRKLIYVLIFILLNACTKEEETSYEDIDIPVVEAFLEPGDNIIVKLSKMLPFTEDEYTGSLIIDDANVYINYNGIDYLLSPVDGSPGKYENLNSNLSVISGGTYNLFFDYNGSLVSSSTIIPSIPASITLSNSVLEVDPEIVGPTAVVNPMIVSWDNPDNFYHSIILEYMEPTYDPISENLGSDSYDNFRKVSTEPVLDNSYQLNTRQHLLFFGDYRVVIYKVNKEYVDLYENVSQSSQNLTEPLTNIENGLGVFTGLNSDTLFLKVKEI